MAGSEPNHGGCARASNVRCRCLLARRALGQAEAGAVVTIAADDPLARIDMPAFCQAEGHVLIAIEAAGSGQIFRIRKA